MMESSSYLFTSKRPGSGLAICVVCLGLLGCGTSEEKNAEYREGPSTVEGGSGRTFMDREIADVMASEHGSLWLDRPERDVEELPLRLLRVLDIGPSSIVADIGAGTGYFTFRIAPMVPHGRVYAVEVQRALVDTLSARAGREGFRNVSPVLGSETNPGLPANRMDLVLIVSSYHEFSYPREMVSAIRDALKPLGRLAIVEYRAEDPTIDIPRAHRMNASQIRREMEAAGFRFREAHDVLPQQHVLVFEKPAIAD